MRFISLHGKYANNKQIIVDDDVFEKFGHYKWQAMEHKEGYYYARRTILVGRKKYATQLLHRIIMDAPKGLDVDHINGDTLDCQRKNLRLVTRQQNQQNKVKKSNRLLPKGIRIISGKYNVRIVKNRKEFALGSYVTLEDAVKAYNRNAIRLFGEYAKLTEI